MKLKATNRTHAGHSRYIDIEDPTGRFSKVTLMPMTEHYTKTTNQRKILFLIKQNQTQILTDDIARMTKHYSLQNSYMMILEKHMKKQIRAFDLLEKDIMENTTSSKK